VKKQKRRKLTFERQQPAQPPVANPIFIPGSQLGLGGELASISPVAQQSTKDHQPDSTLPNPLINTDASARW
jgi:hypothetical protein